ncbi:MAG: hypothetical protein ACT60Q_28080, partial [Ferrovibrionaceae bacterium]
IDEADDEVGGEGAADRQAGGGKQAAGGSAAQQGPAGRRGEIGHGISPRLDVSLSRLQHDDAGSMPDAEPPKSSHRAPFEYQI